MPGDSLDSKKSFINKDKNILFETGTQARLTISARLFLAMLLSFGIILGVYLVLDMQETHREYHRLERNTLTAFIPGIGRLVDSAMLKEDRKHIDEVFERMMRNGPFSSVELLDPDRKVVNTRDFRQGSAPGKSASLSKVPEHYTEVEFPVLNRPACVRCHGSGKTTLGTVRIVAPLERSREMLGRHLRRRLALGAVALILAGLFAAGFLRATVQAPMRRMLRAMERVRGGDLEARLDPELPGELSLMAHRFNAMARRLREDREEIDRMYRRQVAHMDRLASLGELAANFAHEVRNPLTGIGSAIQVLQQGMPAQDDRRGVLAKVLGQVDRINKTLENFLHFSRMPEARKRLFELSEPLLRVRFLLESRARSQGVSLVCEAGSGLPTVFGDPGQIEQVLLNLGLNALQAMGGKGTLDIQARRDPGGGTLIAIADSGPGIAAESLEKVFEPFYTTRKDGSGLGLSIARRIIEDHGGELWLESVPGEGATAYVRLPPPPRGEHGRAPGTARPGAQPPARESHP